MRFDTLPMEKVTAIYIYSETRENTTTCAHKKWYYMKRSFIRSTNHIEMLAHIPAKVVEYGRCSMSLIQWS